MEETKYVTIPLEEYKKMIKNELLVSSREKQIEKIILHLVVDDDWKYTSYDIVDLCDLGSYHCVLDKKDVNLIRSLGATDDMIHNVLKPYVASRKLQTETK